MDVFSSDGPIVTRTRSYSIFDAAMPSAGVALVCAIDANPIEMSRIRWLRNDQEISSTTQAVQWEQRFENNETSLIARSIRREDAGQYACEIENAHGTTRATLPLVVQCESLNAEKRSTPRLFRRTGNRSNGAESKQSGDRFGSDVDRRIALLCLSCASTERCLDESKSRLG